MLGAAEIEIRELEKKRQELVRKTGKLTGRERRAAQKDCFPDKEQGEAKE